jgi:hypothetical protein
MREVRAPEVESQRSKGRKGVKQSGQRDLWDGYTKGTMPRNPQRKHMRKWRLGLERHVTTQKQGEGLAGLQYNLPSPNASVSICVKLISYCAFVTGHSVAKPKT